jgi:hypothetical protein
MGRQFSIVRSVVIWLSKFPKRTRTEKTGCWRQFSFGLIRICSHQRTNLSKLGQSKWRHISWLLISGQSFSHFLSLSTLFTLGEGRNVQNMLRQIPLEVGNEGLTGCWDGWRYHLHAPNNVLGSAPPLGLWWDNIHGGFQVDNSTSWEPPKLNKSIKSGRCPLVFTRKRKKVSTFQHAMSEPGRSGLLLPHCSWRPSVCLLSPNATMTEGPYPELNCSSSMPPMRKFNLGSHGAEMCKRSWYGLNSSYIISKNT